MSTVIRKYEATYILDPTMNEETIQQFVDRFAGMVSNEENPADIKPMGRRRMTYEVKGKTEGIYVTMRYTASTAQTAELRRQMTLADEVLRSLFLNLN
jgi:small subunit ribosomal protein S6